MDKVEQYLQTATVPVLEKFQHLEQFAREHSIPIMEPVSMNFLTQLIRIKKPSTILEIGTAIGYSALRMLDAYSEAMITTIEKNQKMYELAKQHVVDFQLEERILLQHGDALDVIAELATTHHSYDVIFIDAAKAQYQRFFEAVQPLTKRDTVIICDNILFKGYVADEMKVDNKRMATLAKKIRTFNNWLINHPDYYTSIIPIGDGVSISVKAK